MERLVCLIFKVFSSLLSNFKSLWTKVSCCVQKANRRVYYIDRYEHLIGRYGRIATRYDLYSEHDKLRVVHNNLLLSIKT